jgi:CheY-like chemotaxis protein
MVQILCGLPGGVRFAVVGFMTLSHPLSFVIAVVNSNDDLVALLKEALERDGYSVVTGHIHDFRLGPRDFGSFLRAHKPAAVIYDIAIPYDENWEYLQTLLTLPEAQQTSFVVTTVNLRALTDRVGPTEAIEIQGGHADDLDSVVDAIHRIVRPPT